MCPLAGEQAGLASATPTAQNGTRCSDNSIRDGGCQRQGHHRAGKLRFAGVAFPGIEKPKKINRQTITTNKRIQQGDYIQDQCTKINSFPIYQQ